MSHARPTALVTGACGGIGAAICDALAADGLRVAALDLEGAGPPDSADVFLPCDLRDGDAVAAAVADAAGDGDLRAVVHAAGIARDRVLWKLAPEDWNAVLDVNLTGAYRLLHAAVPALRASGGGAVTLISSINGERGKFGQTAYAAAKSGLIGLAKSLAREVGRFNIRVNTVAPGMILTPMTEELPDEIRKAALGETCLSRLGSAEDVAGAVAFLTGPAARHITGQVLRVDGGQLT